MITIQNIAETIKGKLLCCSEKLNSQVHGAYCSDMLSDVMGKAKEGQVWVTMQVHKNIVAVATLKELAAIIVVNGYKVNDDTIDACTIEGIPLISTEMPAFETAGEIYKLIDDENLPG